MDMVRLERREADVPKDADFCLITDSDCMEPEIKKGQKIYVSRRKMPGNMDLGLFVLRGRIMCRRLCVDYSGAVWLLCANEERAEESIVLRDEEINHCVCLGKLLLEEMP